MEARPRRLDPVTTSKRAILPAAIAGLAVSASAALLLTHASRVSLVGGFGDRDLEILRRWIATGALDRLPGASDHLLKPGYLAWLRLVLGDREPFPIRRLLTVDALLVASAVAAVTGALWMSGRRRTAAAAAFVLLAYVPLRDAVGYVLSEPASAAGLLFGIALLVMGERFPPTLLFLGVPIGLTALVRPNAGEILLLLTILVVARFPHAASALASVLVVTVAIVAAAVWAGKRSGVEVSPLGVRATNVFLWGAADYYWEADVAPWPEGATIRDQRRLESARAGAIWKAKLRRWSADDRRALAWKAGHAYLSCEQLPPRGGSAAYLRYDRFLRRWWWVLALAAAALAAAVAAGGNGPWRFAPALLVAVIVLQGVVVGADPRFALPLVPVLAVTLLLALPGWRLSSTGAGAAGVVFAAGVGLVAAVPDAANSDFGVLRGSRTLSFSAGPRAFPASGQVATLHVRLLEPPQTFVRGVAIDADGKPIARYVADPSRPEPPYLTAQIPEPLLSKARRSGLRIDLRPEGGDPGAFLYFPLVTPPWARPATIDGSRTIASGYGGVTSGGIPFWIHVGVDEPLAIETAAAR